MNWKEKWKVVEELPGGGQGKVYRVLNKLELLGAADSIIEQIRNLTATIVQRSKEERIDTLLEQLPKFIALSDINNHYALKELHDPQRARDPVLASMRMEREIEAMKILTEINHPNLIKLIDHNENDLWFVTKFYPRGSVENNRHYFTSNSILVLESIYELLSSLDILHKKKFIHRDIKPENIFVSNNNQLILGDFGLVYPIDENYPRKSAIYDNVGSRDWEPPWAYGERIEDVNATFDLFSIGKVIWSMISGKHILRLWYFDRKPYNLENIFPDDPGMVHVNKLLSRLIVEEENDCLKNAKSLQNLIKSTIDKIKNESPYFDSSLSRLCPICREGHFKLISKADRTATHNFGLEPSGSRNFYIFECPHCGYIQLFSINNTIPPAWKDSPISKQSGIINQPTRLNKR